MHTKAVGLLLSVVLGLGHAATAQTLSGAYLAARQAGFEHDYAASADYFARAIQQDPDRVEFLERATLAYLSLGDIEQALITAERLEELGQQSTVARMSIAAHLGQSEQYQALLDRLTTDNAVGPLADGFVRAWALLGTGDMSAALTAFDQIGQDEPTLASFGAYHKALAMATVGDFEGAEALFSGETIGPLQNTRRGVIAQTEILSQLDRYDDAIALLDASFGDQLDPGLEQLRAALQSRTPQTLSIVADAREGLAETFYTLASALSNEADDDFTLLYARVALHIRPGHADGVLLTAQLLEDLGRYELAVEAYKTVPRSDPTFHAAELGRAAALRESDRMEAAVEVLESLSATHGNIPAVHSSLADVMRRMERYDEAAESYDLAIALYKEPAPELWPLYYARGTVLDQLDRWDEAEADFRMALDLNPGQPNVLNYLGYSMVQRGLNLDEALAMIEEAVAIRPESGYIIDSLGWVLYRLGRYDEAVPHMERAAELMAVDPIVNDHLGDVYWAVGRTREAEFQWRRALSFVEYESTAEELDADRIRRKLEVGLDQVLAEDDEPPLKANDQN
ncbi:tetratricopeptide repeat protein [Pseudoprimorskyibacter insulae]|uniref:Beta-barrel assembly-enhancing protease n=1 Tax=Pseudoprimorskyibacter insulae TaxID=1695997 RepID=A0A2R8ANR3_9RHOB|nr:tetratricopeptide repeat protein [Pseudoprimorskyibacter insulae]SPF77655.1 Beta-barrel assembly-enhancing protease [Pseudoprimorskyibacter insulae]